MRWHGRKDGRLVKWQGGRFAVLFKGETNWVIIFLFLMLINKMKEHDEFKIFLCGRGDGEIFHPWN